MTRILACLLISSACCFGQAFSFRDLPFMQPRGSEPLLGGLAAVWSFDEPILAGNRTNSLDAAILPLVDKNNNAAAFAGLMQGALDQSANSQTRILNNADLGLGTGSFTMAFWMVDPNGANSFIDESTGATHDWTLSGGGSLIGYDALANAYILNGVIPDSSSTNWTFIAFGWDQANLQFFAYTNNGPRRAVNFTGVTRNSGRAFTLNWSSGGVDELMLWKRVLSASEVTRLYNNGNGLKYPFSSIPQSSQIASNYLWSCMFNGGVAPSTNVLNAVDAFAAGLISDGLWASTRYILTFDSTSLTNALTPIKYPVGGDGNANTIGFGNPAINVSGGFVAGDLTVNGLKGDASSKYLQLGKQPPIAGNQFDSQNFAFCLGIAAVTASGQDFGGLDGGASGANFAAKLTDNSVRSRSGALGNTVTNVVSPGAGFYMDSRVSTTDHRLYFASPAVPWAQYGTNDPYAWNSQWTLAYQNPFWLFGVNVAGGLTSPSSDTISFFAMFNRGLSSGDGQAFFNRVETLFSSRAGGYPPITFTVQPTNSAVLFGNSRTFYADAASVTAYQWKKNGTAIAGATQSSYTIPSATLSDSALYTCFLTVGGLPYQSSAELNPVTTTTVSNWLCTAYGVNGAGPVSSNSTWAVDRFWNGLVTDALDTKTHVLGVFVPDNVKAALTPLIGPNWVNHGFVDSDLSVNGLTGNGSKYADTSYAISSIPSSTSAGMIIYQYNNYGNSAHYDIGAQTGSVIFLIGSDGGGNENGYNGVILSVSGGAVANGFYSDQRTSSTVHKIYFANSGNAHAQVGSDSTSFSSAQTALTAYIMGRNLNGSPLGQTTGTLSVGAITDGLAIGDDANFYTRAQALRTALGGGFR